MPEGRYSKDKPNLNRRVFRGGAPARAVGSKKEVTAKTDSVSLRFVSYNILFCICLGGLSWCGCLWLWWYICGLSWCGCLRLWWCVCGLSWCGLWLWRCGCGWRCWCGCLFLWPTHAACYQQYRYNRSHDGYITCTFHIHLSLAWRSFELLKRNPGEPYSE